MDSIIDENGSSLDQLMQHPAGLLEVFYWNFSFARINQMAFSRMVFSRLASAWPGNRWKISFSTSIGFSLQGLDLDGIVEAACWLWI